jgi:hypothetical protein
VVHLLHPGVQGLSLQVAQEALAEEVRFLQAEDQEVLAEAVVPEVAEAVDNYIYSRLF